MSSTLAKTVLEESFESGKSPMDVVEEKGYTQITDSSVVEGAVNQAIEENPKAVADFLAGKETAAKFLVGQVMRLTKGKANPAVAGEMVTKGLEATRNS